MQLQSPLSSPLPLMLLPGSLCDERLFAPVMHAVGLRSVVVGSLYSATSVTALAHRLLTTAPASFALAGFSLGGIVALEMAALVPDRIAGLALIGSNARAVPAKLHQARRRAARPSGPIADHVELRLWPSYVSPRNLDRSDLQTLVVNMAEASPPGAMEQQTEVLLSRTDSRPRLHSYFMPALILAGADDVFAPPPIQCEMANALPDAELVLVPNAGHFVLLEEPELSATAIGSWLERVDSSCLKQSSEPLEAA